jgi:hypothetical protein
VPTKTATIIDTTVAAHRVLRVLAVLRLIKPHHAIFPTGAERAVEGQRQEWRLLHRLRRAEHALDGDLARFNAGSPGGRQLLQGARRALFAAARWLRSAPGSWSASSPLWHGAPKAVGDARRAKVPRMNIGQLPGGSCAALGRALASRGAGLTPAASHGSASLKP